MKKKRNKKIKKQLKKLLNEQLNSGLKDSVAVLDIKKATAPNNSPVNEKEYNHIKRDLKRTAYISFLIIGLMVFLYYFLSKDQSTDIVKNIIKFLESK